MRHLDDAGIGHVSEVASAEPPFTPGGCPFQVWSLGELLRIAAMLPIPRAQRPLQPRRTPHLTGHDRK
jgi:glycogen debranching enzyme